MRCNGGCLHQLLDYTLSKASRAQVGASREGARRGRRRRCEGAEVEAQGDLIAGGQSRDVALLST